MTTAHPSACSLVGLVLLASSLALRAEDAPTRDFGTPAAYLQTMSVQDLQPKAESGSVWAQFYLAMALQKSGTEPDLVLARQWYERAAQQGLGVAMAALARLLEEGRGGPKDIPAAVAWYEKAIATPQQTFAEGCLLRLSKAGLTDKKYAGIPVEGGLVLSVVDDKTPIAELVRQLADHTKERETGKGYWIGYNEHMLSIAARGDEALPYLIKFVRDASTPQAQWAGLVTIHLIGIESTVIGRFEEDFRDRKAREALWELMPVDGLTDQVSSLLRRDPWPADIFATMAALQSVEFDCPGTLDFLDRLQIRNAPVDSLRDTRFGEMTFKYTIEPGKYTHQQIVRIIARAAEQARSDIILVNDDAFSAVDNENLSGYSRPVEWEGTLAAAIFEMKGSHPPFDYASTGRPVFFYIEVPKTNMDPIRLRFCSAADAKKRWLDWWRDAQSHFLPPARS